MLLLITNRKSYTRSRLAPNSMTLNDLKDLGSEDKNEGKDTALYLRDALKTRTSP